MSVLVLDLAASAYEEDGKAHSPKLDPAWTEGKLFGHGIPHCGIWLDVRLQRMWGMGSGCCDRPATVGKVL